MDAHEETLCSLIASGNHNHAEQMFHVEHLPVAYADHTERLRAPAHYNPDRCKVSARRSAMESATTNHWPYIDGLQPLSAIHYLELYVLTFLQCFESVSVNGAVVHEHIRCPVRRGDKAVAFRVIEPLHDSGLHVLIGQ